MSKDALLQVGVTISRAQWTTSPLSFFFPFFVCFKLPTTASQAQTERRTRLPLVSPGASVFSLPTPPALPKARGHSEGRRPPLRSDLQRVSNSLPPQHHMVITVWALQGSEAFAQLQLRTKFTQSGLLQTLTYMCRSFFILYFILFLCDTKIT